MKKLLAAAVAAITLVGSAFAMDISIDGNFAIPMNFSSSHVNVDINEKNYTHTTISTRETSFGGDVDLKVILAKNFGIKLDLGLWFPQSYTTSSTTKACILGTETNSSTDPVKTSYKSDNSSVSDFSLFVGPTIRLTNKKEYAVAVTPGFSTIMRTISVTTGSGDNAKTTKTKKTTLGFGAEVDGRFNLTKNVYINAACPFVYQFKTVTEDSEKDTKGFLVTPKFGIGYRF